MNTAGNPSHRGIGGNVSLRRARHSFGPETLERRTLLSAWTTVDTVPGSWAGAEGSGMTADKAGNVYAVGGDLIDSTVLYLREKPAGSAAWNTITTMNGGQWGFFNSVAVDAAGDVFITGRNSSGYLATWEMAKGATALTQIDVDSAAIVGFGMTANGGSAVTVDGSGTVYTAGDDATKYKGSIRDRWTVRRGTFANGKWSFSTVDQLLQSQGSAYGVSIAPTGIYVAGVYNGNWTIRKSPTGASGTWTTVDSLSGGSAQGVATDAAGDVYAAGDPAAGWTVRESTNGGASWTTVDHLNGGPSTVLIPSATVMAITRDASGNMVVAGSIYDSVTGDDFAVVRTNAGGRWATLDSYDYPDSDTYYSAVAADTFGNLYAGGEVWDNAGNFVDFIIRSQPAVPTSLTAAADAANPTSQINLTWANTAGSDETGFAVYRSSDGVTFTEIGTVGASTTSYSDTGLSAGTTYFYYVVSLLNATGMSAASNQAATSTSA